MVWIRHSAKHHHRMIRPDARTTDLRADLFLSLPSAGLCICNDPYRRNRPDALTRITAIFIISALQVYNNTK